MDKTVSKTLYIMAGVIISALVIGMMLFTFRSIGAGANLINKENEKKQAQQEEAHFNIYAGREIIGVKVIEAASLLKDYDNVGIYVSLKNGSSSTYGYITDGTVDVSNNHAKIERLGSPATNEALAAGIINMRNPALKSEYIEPSANFKCTALFDDDESFAGLAFVEQ